jgi:DNA ligase (NAD+)
MTKVELEKRIEEANIAYSAGIPFMTDEEYDILWQQLYAIDPTNKLLYHTAQDRTELTGKTWHKYQIFGTNKAFNMEDLKPFLTRFGNQMLVIEPKYDGCAAILTQTKDGMMLTLEGDGRCGGDITHMIPFIKFKFQVRHFQAVEILLPWCDWHESYGKNPRNTVAGWLARKYEKPETMMTAIPHSFGNLSEEYFYGGDLEAMGELLLRLHAEWSSMYPIDGLMIKVADRKQRLIAGNNGQTNNWSIAWKPPIQTKETTVLNIEWNVSRHGKVIPTIIYEPIELCGTTNSRVTGNNAKWLKDRRIKSDSILIVGKAGEIIPKIINVKNPTNSYIPVNLPIHCPTCVEILQWEGVHLVCHGNDCIAQKIVSIAYFYSHKGIKIDGIGEQTIEKILRNKKCYNILANKPWALLDLESYGIIKEVFDILGTATFKNIMGQVAAVNNTKNMAYFIAGLGLPKLAYKTAIRLCQYLKTGKLNITIQAEAQKNFCEAAILFKDATEEMKNFTFASIPNIAKAIYCITGSLSVSRDDMIEFLLSKEFEFSNNVTKETNYLIVGESPGKLKIQKAQKYGIPQITEEQLFKLLKGDTK